MKQLLLILAVAMVAGCTPNDGVKDASIPAPEKYATYEDGWVKVIRIRKCEYIKSEWSKDVPLVHCGDCDNPMHKYITTTN